MADAKEGANRRRRLLLLLIVVVLMLVGSGVGSLILSDPPSPPADNDTTPTPTATPTAPPGAATPTPSGPDTPTGTGTPTTGPATPATASPTPSPTETPGDPSTGTPGATPPPSTPTPNSGGGGSPGGGASPGGGDPPATPSPGLELRGDGLLLSTENLMPGQSGRGTLTLRNAEDEDGNLTITVVDVIDEENGITDPESAVDSSPLSGELSSELEVRIAIEDDDGNREYLLGTDGGYVDLSALPSRTPSSEYFVASGEEVTLVAEWRLPASAGNEVQSDGVVIDVGLRLESTAG